MLELLLTLLLPPKVLPSELAFHQQFVLGCYREYFDRVNGTGYRDLVVLGNLKKVTAYSMNILLWKKFKLWLQIRKFHNYILHFKKSVIQIESLMPLQTLENENVV